MSLSTEVRLLRKKWESGAGWHKRLDWVQIDGIRGWTGQRVDFSFPIVAICGENGSGKSTILQAAASVYRRPGRPLKGYFASEFFPDTPWDRIKNASITFQVREGDTTRNSSLRKPTDRWRGNPERPERTVQYIDLRRTQPVSARVGYKRLAKPTIIEASAEDFDAQTLRRLSAIMGRRYAGGKMALTDEDSNRPVPVLTLRGSSISGFHQGAGELTIAELLANPPIKYSLIIIDEIETSLHPRAQRRLVRDLAELCRQDEIQVILTTHSPYVLGELPEKARGYILQTPTERRVVFGVSPDFALTLMDEETHPECDVYVEDIRAEQMLREILIAHRGENSELVKRLQFIRFGSASVGQALGEMVKAGRLPRPSLVFLDGDQPELPGCIVLPGGDAPERVVFEALRDVNWGDLAKRVGRNYSEATDACERAMTSDDHHEWVESAANGLTLGSNVLWTLMCQVWAALSLEETASQEIFRAVTEALELGRRVPVSQSSDRPAVAVPAAPNEPEQPSEQSETAPPDSDEPPWLFPP